MPETPAHYVVRFKVRKGLSPHVCNFGTDSMEAWRFYQILAASVDIVEAELLSGGTVIYSLSR